jgi:thiol:disulfide interchange protein DsbA
MKKSLLLIILFCFSPLTLLAEEYREGVHYKKYNRPFQVSTGDKIEVKEVFWYGCPHCFNLENPLNKWRLNGIPENAEFVRMPGVFRDSWVPHARAYYAFEALGNTEKLHHELMNTFHVKRQRLKTAEQLADFAAAQGVDRKEFLDAYGSFSVDSLSRQAAVMTQRYNITGVPSIIVDGRYLTGVKMAGGTDKLFQLINYLVARAADERKQEQSAKK